MPSFVFKELLCSFIFEVHGLQHLTRFNCMSSSSAFHGEASPSGLTHWSGLTALSPQRKHCWHNQNLLRRHNHYTIKDLSYIMHHYTISRPNPTVKLMSLVDTFTSKKRKGNHVCFPGIYLPWWACHVNIFWHWANSTFSFKYIVRETTPWWILPENCLQLFRKASSCF